MTVITPHQKKRITLKEADKMYWHLHFGHSKDLAYAWKIECHSTAPHAGSCIIFSEWQKQKEKECF